MLEVSIPDYGQVRLANLVLDYNGTLACDGALIEGVAERLSDLSKDLEIHVVTADTFGKAASGLSGLPCKLAVLGVERQETAKLAFIKELGSQSTVTVGNGRNDRLMLKEAALGVAVVQEEGTAVEAVLAADIVCPDILSALDLLSNPLRLVATLRS